MHDFEFDGDFPKKGQPGSAPDRIGTRSPWVWLSAFRLRWPISRLSQAIFAEAFRQGLAERLTVDRAIRLAAEVTPGRGFRRSLETMAVNVRSGYPLEAALSKTGAVVSPGLLASLRVGEERGCLVEELGSFARRMGGFTARRFHRAIGRSPQAVEFAAALSRMLRDDRLTVRSIRDAGEVAAAGNSRFSKLIEEVARLVGDGYSLPGALSLHPADFDGLYRGFLESAESREEMRACLERLGTHP